MCKNLTAISFINIASYCFAVSRYPLSEITVQLNTHFIHPCMTRVPAVLELLITKVEKLNVRNWRVFANPVTYETAVKDVMASHYLII